jgi:hypothetical protein
MDPERMKQLAPEAESLHQLEAPHLESQADIDDGWMLPRDAVDARFAALGDEDVVASLASEDPCTRLAACWRLMTRDQALGAAPPTDGVRLLLIVNVASVQDLRMLEILAELDPCPTVRAAADTSLWRVARDRDRVVAFLVARLAVERAPAVLVALLDLVPALPFELSSGSLQPLLENRSNEVRRRAMRLWIDADADDTPLADAIIREPDRALRLAALDRCARSKRFTGMPEWISADEVKYDALRVLAAANRRFSLRAVKGLLDRHHLEDVLALVGGPYDDDDRELLLLLTDVFEPDAATRTSPELMRCLAEACKDAPAGPATIARVRAARELVAARLRALGHHTSTTPPHDDDDWYDEDWDDPVYTLVREASALDVLLSALAA